MSESPEPPLAASDAFPKAVDTTLAAPSVPGVELDAESDSDRDQPAPPPETASRRRPYVYSRKDLLDLSNSPLVKTPDGMPSLKEWYGDYYEPSSTPAKKDADAASGRERTRFRHTEEAGDSNGRPTFKAAFSQSTQMGNFKHQSLRDRDPSDRDRDGLRSLSDKYDRDRLSAAATSPLSSTRPGRERDTAPHLAAGTSQRAASGGQASATTTTRKGDVKEGPKRKGETSDDWRRGSSACSARHIPQNV
ncbi:hypothetical protein EXIGLDRAFT_211051 [Exidia glandulosa HHB12029]|uniref:Uncharacterized protein n=1 Tax=Exidia glandulosa HHB12029 TaxID=1314781 RepID=A0A165EJQ3_EXIGL|nr:hypothetical protein EXIGLDRAFT_211051 [Exidia glandulosa HHB12029]